MQYITVSRDISLSEINAAMSRGVPERNYRRSSGTHLTDILQAVRKSDPANERVVFGRSTFAPIDEEALPVCMLVGLSIEDMLIKTYPYLMRIGEISKDGIAMSPDAVMFKTKKHLRSPYQAIDSCIEFKATWKSSRRILEESPNYIQQIKSYCYALETRFAILWVLHVVGDYQFGSGKGPELIQHHIEFTDWELSEHWKYILRKKKEFGL